MEWTEQHIAVEPPKRPKKITGTRLASILGLNHWKTPFSTWCEITRTYEEPFEDTIYTIAGKVIEPKLIRYVAKRYFLDVKTPEDVYGKDFFKKTYGDFFKNESPIFGGMWDAIADNTVIEIKTTKRSEDWVGDTPEYYKLQAALYAYLLGVDNIIFCCGFLTDDDYARPEDFVPIPGQNVVVRQYSLSKDFPNMDEVIAQATTWWNEHVLTGVSPDYDSKADADIIKALRTTTIEDTEDLQSVINNIEVYSQMITDMDKERKPVEDKLKKEQGRLKAYLQNILEEDSTKDCAAVKGLTKMFVLTKQVKTTVDDKKLKKDGLFDQYKKVSVSYVLRNKNIEEEENAK